MSKHNVAVTTDSVIFFRKADKDKVLLVKRGNDPFQGKWALPGGFLKDEEPLVKGAARELQEETGLKMDKLQQLKAFGGPGRDPRGRIISIAFFGEVTSEEKVKGADDAAEADWFDLDNLPELAFDHSEIVEYARKRIHSEE